MKTNDEQCEVLSVSSSVKHQYTLPVEWEYYVISYDSQWAYPNENWTPGRKVVTMLRCVCGKEAVR